MAKEQERLELQRERERQREAMREAQARDAAAATPLRESAASGLGKDIVLRKIKSYILEAQSTKVGVD